MSEVLRRLALRALGQANEIRPRTPSLYEGGGGWLEAEAVEEGAPATPPPAAVPPAAMPFAPAIAPVPEMQAVERAVPRADAAPPAFAPAPIAAAPAVLSIQRKATAPAERIAADMPAASAIPQAYAPAAFRLEQAEAVPAAIAASPVNKATPADRASPRAFAAPPLLPERAPAPAPYEPPRLDPSSRPPASAGAPDIHISIGRVEVRADLPEARPQPRAAPRPSPFMSLEDYLGGARGRRR